MKKVFVLDTNVVLDDPDAIFKFEDNDIVIPDDVLEEVDRFKNERNTERGANSRRFSRHLDALRLKGNLTGDGVSLGEGMGKLKVKFTPKKHLQNQEEYFLESAANVDNRIMYLCKNMKGFNEHYDKEDIPIILVTEDTNLRVKANTIEVKAQDYLNAKIVRKADEFYSGRRKVLALPEVIQEFIHNGNGISQKDLLDVDGRELNDVIFPNEFFEIYDATIVNEHSLGTAVLGRFNVKEQKVVPLAYLKELLKKSKKMSIHLKPRNIGQQFALEALLAPPDVAPLVILKGIAGTAKTFLSVGAGLYSGMRELYNQVMICRPSVTMDEDIGFLPGAENEKIEPYMRAIKDNVYTLLYGSEIEANQDKIKRNWSNVETMFLNGTIKAEALAYQRGRSLNHYYFILDEMQNATRSQAKTIVTRGGIGTKIVLLGDPDQIDSAYLDAYNNGLTYVSESMKGSPLCWQVTMNPSEGTRSQLSKDAVARMK